MRYYCVGVYARVHDLMCFCVGDCTRCMGVLFLESFNVITQEF
jgi:hypothetical protein